MRTMIMTMMVVVFLYLFSDHSVNALKNLPTGINNSKLQRHSKCEIGKLGCLLVA